MKFWKDNLTAACGQTKPLNPRRPSGVLQQVDSTLNLAECGFPLQVQAVDNALDCQTYTDNIKGGTYTSSCFDVYYNTSAQLLSATCGTGTGGFMQTSVNTSYCTPTSTVSNDHGVLVCSDYTSAVPAGSWQDSCGAVSYSPQGWLVAFCSSGTGSVLTAVAMSTCANGAQIQNIYGLLRC
eukprot:gene5795-6035_t